MNPCDSNVIQKGVVMGWNGSSTAANASPSKPKKAAKKIAAGEISPAFKSIVALVVIAIIAGLAYVCFTNDEVKAKVKEKLPKRHIAEVQAEITEPQEVEEVHVETPEEIAKRERREKLKKMTPEERLDFLFEEAKNKPIDFNNVSTNRPFATGTEQVMSWIFTTTLGNMPPPLPRISIRDEAHLAEILMADNPALEGDSEKVKNAKEMVELAKKEAIEFVKQGGDVTEFLEYYRGELVQAHNEWQESQKSVMQVIREEPDIAAEYIEEVNAKLAEKGIKPVNVPPKFREQLGLE